MNKIAILLPLLFALSAFGQTSLVPPPPVVESNNIVVCGLHDESWWGDAVWTQHGTNWTGYITFPTNSPFAPRVTVRAPTGWSRSKIFQTDTNSPLDTWPAMVPVAAPPSFVYTLTWTNAARFSIDCVNWGNNLFAENATITKRQLP